MLLKLFQAHVALINNEYYLIKLKSLKKHILMSKLTIILLLYLGFQYYTHSITYCDHHPAIDSILPDMSEDTFRKNEFVKNYEAQPGHNFVHDYLKEFYPEDLAKENQSNLKKTLIIIGGVALFILLTYLWFLYETAPSEESLDHLYKLVEKAVQENYKPKP